MEFRNDLAKTVFYNKYAHNSDDTWANLAERLVDDVCGTFQGQAPAILTSDERGELVKAIREFKFIPGGRYLYYAGRPLHYWNNCFLLKCEEDTREEWGALVHRSTSCLMSGGGIGIDYSILRHEGAPLSRTGGISSGPISLIKMVNEVGRYVMQGGSRRSAIYASLNWQHPDAQKFLVAKNWHDMPVGSARQGDRPYTLKDAKQDDFNFIAPLDMTNISLNYDDEFLKQGITETFLTNCRQAMSTGEPGFSFNFGEKQNETLRNACTEVTSSDDSDVCNLGSLNLANIDSKEEFQRLVELGSKFLVCGTTRADLPYKKVYKVREKNRRLGLGLMGIHEWLLKRGEKYEVTKELHKWLGIYKDASETAAIQLCDSLGISRPVAFRAIAPTGSIGILAGTTTGIEPLYAVAYKRRYLKHGSKWHYKYVIDSTAEQIIRDHDIKPDAIETAASLAQNFEQRIRFQADVQDYVDMSISSTINLPAWGNKHNNEDKVKEFADTLFKYAPRLRGFTAYPDGARGGQPITEIDYREALEHKGVEFQEHDICDLTGKGGTCGS